MPWQEVRTVDLRHEFALLARAKTMSFTELCRRFSISRKTGYKWLARYESGGVPALHDQSRVPIHQPNKTSPSMEAIVVAARDRYPVWGGRKLHEVLFEQGYVGLPCPSTITEILRRNGRLTDSPHSQTNYIRFEHDHPNDLWQMDFKGHFRHGKGECHPLTVLDDCSRYSLCLEACRNERTDTVKERLIKTFERYGLPNRMTMDNGSPWGSSGASRYTQLTIWLIEQGIRVSHSRPYHPQTQGKDERFHRTLKAELIGRRQFKTLDQCQTSFDAWRAQYNTIRPHEALDMKTPATRYTPSQRCYDDSQPEYEYGVTDEVRKVGKSMVASFKCYELFIGEPFIGKRIAIRPTMSDGQYTLHFCQQQIGKIDLTQMTKRKR